MGSGLGEMDGLWAGAFFKLDIDKICQIYYNYNNYKQTRKR